MKHKICPICMSLDQLEDENKRLTVVEEICDICKTNMKEGVIFLTYSQIIEKEIVRSGGYFVLKEEGVRLLFRGYPEEIENALKKRIVYLSDEQAHNFKLLEFAAAPNKAKNKAKEYNKGQEIVPGLNDMK